MKIPIVNYPVRVANTFGAFVRPEEEETWKELHTRLLKTIFEPGFTPVQSLVAAAELGCERTIHALFDLYPKLDVDASGGKFCPTALIQAASKGHAHAMRALLEHGASLEKTFCRLSAISIAYVHGNSLECVRLCLERGVKVDHRLASEVIDRQDEEAVTLFEAFSQTLDVDDRKGESPLFQLVKNEEGIDLEKLTWALEQGCSPNRFNAQGATVLHLAYGRCALKAIQLFYDYGAHVVEDRNGSSPFHYYLFKGDPEQVWDLQMLKYKSVASDWSLWASFQGVDLSLKAFILFTKVKAWLFPRSHGIDDCMHQKGS